MTEIDTIKNNCVKADVILSFFFFFFCAWAVFLPSLPKNNLFDYQAFTRFMKNSCKYIWSISGIWCIFVS